MTAAGVVALLGATSIGPAAAATPTPTPQPGTPSAAAPPTASPTSTIGGAGLLRPGVLVDAPARVPAPPPLKAGSYVVADADDGRVILSFNAHVQARPASTLKTLTALTVAGKLSPTRVVVGHPQDAAVDGTKVGILPGEQYTVRELLLGLLLSSGNDAANALARANGGIAATAQEMTQRAHRIGALDTFAKNPSGLDATGQLTSAYDLALLGRAAIQDPDVAPYLTVKTAELPGPRTAGPKSKRQRYQIGSHNKLLWNYAGTIGVKNGFTKAAKQTYVGAARRGDQTYVITYLGGNGVAWQDAAKVLDWAFAYGDKTAPVGQLVDAETFDPQATAPVAPAEAEATGGAAPTSTAALLHPSGGGTLAVLGGAVAVTGIVGTLVWNRLRRSRSTGRRG